MLFTAGNLLPQQVIITPLFRHVPGCSRCRSRSATTGLLYDQYFGIIAHPHRRSRLGFCTFVLSNYMKTLPKELTEAALVDGASVLDDLLEGDPAALPAGAGGPRDARVHVHLQRLLLGADPDEDRRQAARSPRPSTTSRAQFFTDHNLLAAASLIVAVPTVLVYLVLLEAVRPRPDAGVDEGLIQPAQAAVCPVARRGGLVRS